MNSSHPWGSVAAITVVVGMFKDATTPMLIIIHDVVTAAGMSHVFLWRSGYATAAVRKR